MKNATIKGYCKAVGVKHPTVSKAFKRAGGVNEKTRQAHTDTAKKR